MDSRRACGVSLWRYWSRWGLGPGTSRPLGRRGCQWPSVDPAGMSKEERDANARLVAASPLLLELYVSAYGLLSNCSLSNGVSSPDGQEEAEYFASMLMSEMEKVFKEL